MHNIYATVSPIKHTQKVNDPRNSNGQLSKSFENI